MCWIGIPETLIFLMQINMECSLPLMGVFLKCFVQFKLSFDNNYCTCEHEDGHVLKGAFDVHAENN